MPTVINGIGTWYYGKRRIHRVKGLCDQCNVVSELESYDTTLYFVFIMIPIIPLGQKRILEKCGKCERHRLLPLKEWEAAKTRGMNEVLEKLSANPDDQEAIQAALGLATYYQDAEAFDKLVPALASHRTDDVAIQTLLGRAYEYFSRWAEAEEAYERAFAQAPSDELRERLAVCMLKQHRPEDAAPHVTHVFEQKDPQKAWLLYWLIEGCMEKGLHVQALELMDHRDATFPELANEEPYKVQRRTAQKYKDSGKPIRSAMLNESGRTGYRTGSGLGFKWPKYVGAALLLGLLALYLGTAWYRGQNRQVHLVNGWKKPYVATINGQRHELQPGQVAPIKIPEGQLVVDWPESGDGPQEVTLTTSFWGRPFNSPVFVLNPDQCAVLVRQEATYAQQPVGDDPPPTYHTGQLLHQYDGIHHVFEPFPESLKLDKGSRTTRTRLAHVIMIDSIQRLRVVTNTLPHPQQRSYAHRLVHLDPDDDLVLHWLVNNVVPAEALALLRPRLADRPIRIEWHRLYQSTAELAEPTVDLAPTYQPAT